MADARGKGFNRGQGKWHAYKPTPPTPATYGWKRLHWNKEYNLQVWHIGKIKLMAHPDYPGGFHWLVQIDDSNTADHWQGPLEKITKKVLGENDD